MNSHGYSCLLLHEIILGLDNCTVNLFKIFACLIAYLPWFMNIHGYSCLLYSKIFMVQFYIHEYSRYKTGLIHECSRICTMNIIELF